MSLNKVELIGYLGNDPDLRYMPNGNPTVSCSIATTSRWTDKSGAKKERTEWHRVIFFNGLAEIASEYLKKGSHLYVEGNLRTRPWTDKNNVTRNVTEIVVSELLMLDKKGDANNLSTEGSSRLDETPEPSLDNEPFWD